MSRSIYYCGPYGKTSRVCEVCRRPLIKKRAIWYDKTTGDMRMTITKTCPGFTIFGIRIWNTHDSY